MTESPNPYTRNGKWFFYDETGDEYGPFPSERKATRELLRYCHYLNYGPTLWQRIFWPIKELLRCHSK